MSNTFGHTLHRYVGAKLYHAERAARKAAPVADSGNEPDESPFWTKARCECNRCDACESESLAWRSEMDHYQRVLTHHRQA